MLTRDVYLSVYWLSVDKGMIKIMNLTSYQLIFNVHRQEEGSLQMWKMVLEYF